MENVTLINYHKTRDFSSKMNVTFEFIRQNFKGLAKSILFIAGPPVIVASLFLGSFMGEFFTATFNMGAGNPDAIAELMASPNLWLQIGVMVVFFILSFVAMLSTINNYIILYEEKQTNKIDVRDVWERVRETFGMYLGTAILYSVLMFAIFFILTFIGGISAAVSPLLAFFVVIGLIWGGAYVFVATSLIFVIRSYEKLGFFDAFGRSMSLVKGKWWSTFGLMMVLSMIGGVISYIFMIPWYAVTIVSAVHDTGAGGIEASGQSMGILGTILFTLYYMAQVLLQVLPNLGAAFQYFNLVERKEARGLLNQIDSIGQAPAAPTHEEHY